MFRRRLAAALAAAALPLSALPTVAVAQEAAPGASENAPFGRLPEDRGPAIDVPGRRVVESTPRETLPGQPRNDVIEDVPVDPGDASIPLNLIPYHEIPPALRALQESDRISVEIIGQSVQGRDLHLVVATSPMSNAEWAEWQELSDLRTADPDAAMALLEAGGYDDWKSPLFINNNIHGNEWEGTDAALEVLEDLAFSDDAETVKLLDEHVIAFVVTNNPDGRVNATRANANGFDMNRDYITQSQPEVRIVRDQIIRYDPLTFLDQHGYVGCTLIEPTTGPHGDNYEYDLYIRHALRNALSMEQAVVALGQTYPNATCSDGQGGQRTRIPYRNNTTGWDDWPPIFTPMYAMYHGSVGHTIEFPLNPRSSALTEADRHERTRINTAISRATMEGNFAYANENRIELLRDQIEIYRRGVHGEPLRPIDDPLALELAAGDNAQTVEIDLPRAYVIPVGDVQRSDSAAARVVQFLLDNDVEVQRAEKAFTLNGTRYPAGSYVVDGHQAKRGMANVILDTGRDVTDAYPTMYDIAAWSIGELWGARVDRIADGSLDNVRSAPIHAPVRTGSVAPGNRSHYAFTVDSKFGVQAVNDLLTAGVELSRTPDGTFVVPGSALAQIRELATTRGIVFEAITPARVRTAEPFDTFRIGISAPNDEAYALRELGYDVTVVNHTGFNNGSYAFDDFDAFYVSSTAFNPLNLNATQQQAFADWLAAGNAVALRGANGKTFSDRAQLLVTELGPVRSDANGIVAVVNDPDSRITGDAGPRSFVNSPRWFTSYPETANVDQHLAEGDFFLAGHWIGNAAAAGQPVVISDTARGAHVTMFTTEPLYRNHSEGLFIQVAEALWATAD
ncbi:M14 family zinc carboxypeptidase [Egicoccus sp. AB-alg2]|uniref:M14 family zinc carboxypeptidase n=1 Tax=Egicoccus sp. AB-alg2 TaxID=3242693 RepID=UPI00359F1328